MKVIQICLIVLVISACSPSAKKPAQNHYYRFPTVTLEPVKNLNLIIKRPSAMGILGNRPMVVKNQDGALIQMNNNFWLDSPKTLLHNYLEKVFLENANNNSTQILNAQILQLEKTQDTAQVAIKFMILDDQNQLVFNKTYKAEKKLEQNSIPAFVKSISALLESLVQQFIHDLP